MKKIQIEEDGWVSVNDQGLGDLGIDVEIIDKRENIFKVYIFLILSMIISGFLIEYLYPYWGFGLGIGTALSYFVGKYIK